MNYSEYRLREEQGTIPPGTVLMALHKDGERFYCGRVYKGNLKQARVFFRTTRDSFTRRSVTLAPVWVAQVYLIPYPRRILFLTRAARRYHASHANR